MKRFMFLSIGVLCLAIAALIGSYIGASRAEAGSGSADTYVGFSYIRVESREKTYIMAMKSDGSVYATELGEGYTYPLIFRNVVFKVGSF